MKILAVECSAVSASAALCEDERLAGEFYVNIRQTHSETLMPEIVELLQRCKTSPGELDLFAVAAGPGSFTGVRIGVAAVKGLALARGTPCAAVSPLEAAAMNLPFFDGVVCAVMDARRSQFYNALFDTSSGSPRRLTPDRAIGADELLAGLKNTGKKVVLVGDGAGICYNSINGSCDVLLAPERLRHQRAAGVAFLGRAAYDAGLCVSPECLQPVYLRLPQAERELRRRENSL